MVILLQTTRVSTVVLAAGLQAHLSSAAGSPAHIDASL
jgi:hypothetical protein